MKPSFKREPLRRNISRNYHLFSEGRRILFVDTANIEFMKENFNVNMIYLLEFPSLFMFSASFSFDFL